RPASCASSPMKPPAPCVTIGVRNPDWSCRVMSTWPERMTVRPWPTSPHQWLAGAIGTDLAEPAYPLGLRSLQDREHLVASRIDDRLRRDGHDCLENRRLRARDAGP